MSRWLIALALVPSVAAAEEDEVYYDESIGERELVGSVGAALGGGDVTPGGLRVAGSYLYQLAEDDWFEGGLAFTFGSGGAECFRDRDGDVVCDHGAADGVGVDLGGGVRRFFGGNQGFRPWLRASAAVRLLRFADDDVTGVGVVLGASGGVRARIADTVAVGGHGGLELGGALLSRDIGPRPQLGLVIGATVEVALP